MITVSIIAIMASMLLFALYNAQESAKASRTRALVAKLDAIVKARWDAYQTRRVPIDTTGMSPVQAAQARLNGLRDLMRMELPDRWSDIVDPPATWAPTSVTRPALSQAYLRKYTSAPGPPSDTYASAECLYLIVMAALQEEGDSREVFKADTIGDVDGDTMPEFLDGWGVPIKFLRWAPGFLDSELQVVARVKATASGTALTIAANQSAKLNPTAGSYVGGSVYAVVDASSSQPALIDTLPSNKAQIVGYNVSGGVATVTLASSVTVTNEIVITAPDPFDPTGVYSGTMQSFAIYPLIFSSGPNKCSGVFVGPASHHVAAGAAPGDPFLNPFFAIDDPVNPPVKIMVGTTRNDPGESNYVSGAWHDNIHNHLIGLK